MPYKLIYLAISVSLLVINSLASAAPIGPAPYAFSMDSFEIQMDSSAYVVDDFNDGDLSALWEIYEPTVVESDGVVTFQSPGEIVEEIPGILTSWSYIGSTFEVTDDWESFTGTSTWLPTVPQLNQFYSMSLSMQTQEISVSVVNLEDPVLAPDFFGIQSGLGIWFSTHTESDGLLDSQFYQFDETDIMGDILLQLVFDDNTSAFNAAFSLDGGTTMVVPFTSIVTGPIVSGNWSFGAESFSAVPEPSTLLLMATGLAGLGFASRKKKQA